MTHLDFSMHPLKVYVLCFLHKLAYKCISYRVDQLENIKCFTSLASFVITGSQLITFVLIF